MLRATWLENNAKHQNRKLMQTSSDCIAYFLANDLLLQKPPGNLSCQLAKLAVPYSSPCKAAFPCPVQEHWWTRPGRALLVCDKKLWPLPAAAIRREKAPLA